MRILVVFLALIGAVLLYMIWKNLTVPKNIGLEEGMLHPCPRSPNCVQSCLESDAEHAIAPLPYRSDQTLDQIEEYLKAHYIAKVMEKTETYLYVVVTTPLCRYRDDLEFLVVKDKNEVCVRSASRVGYGDGGVNRARIENIRKYLMGVQP
ncbi:MAG: DUF1499 domain-containing protein [Verrucomicrobia bacterium]|nr:DUF1499 domain-containing protein [Verrucomicrobiota bacterium]